MIANKFWISTAFYLLFTRSDAQIIDVQLEYRLAINRSTAFQIKALKDSQNECLRRMYGASKRA